MKRDDQACNARRLVAAMLVAVGSLVSTAVSLADTAAEPASKEPRPDGALLPRDS